MVEKKGKEKRNEMNRKTKRIYDAVKQQAYLKCVKKGSKKEEYSHLYIKQRENGIFSFASLFSLVLQKNNNNIEKISSKNIRKT